MSTKNPDVSPIIDTTRFGVIFVENSINNLPLSNNDFIITSTCVLTAQTPATTTTTSTTTLPQFGNLCFIVSGYFALV
jgi:hypothetical protein